MSRVIFMCGPAGSGKSTLAKRFEDQGMVRLSFDQEAWNRGIRVMPMPSHIRNAIETDLRHRLTTLVNTGRDVVLDFSFWSRAMRQDWRKLLAPLGVEPELVYLNTDRDTCLERIRSRTLGHADDFALDPTVAGLYFDNFEVPTSDEGRLTVVRFEPLTGSSFASADLA